MEELAIINKTISDENIKTKIYTIRGLQVMLDSDLAELYEVPIKRLNEQVKRNIERFPNSFRFQLNQTERNELVAKCDHLENIKFSYTLPYVFTEQGVSMLSAVLKSQTAINTSIRIIELFARLEQIEKRQITYEIKSDEKFEKIFNAIEEKSIKPKQSIFYDGQVYDSYIFISDLIKSAKNSIILIDNYIDDSVLTLLSKKDIKKHNTQYPEIKIKKFTLSHDRFLILDENEVYHIGASLKDLGKKWFAFSKFDINSFEILSKIKGI